MKKLLIMIVFILSASIAYAQYGVIEPRGDYREAFTTSSSNVEWSREIDCSKSKSLMLAEIAKRISISVVVDNMVIGKLEEVDFSGNAKFSTSRIPWDSSTFKADVIYELHNNGYKVTVSNILYKSHLDDRYLSIHSIIYNANGNLRSRGDGDLIYFDNAFCAHLLIE